MCAACFRWHAGGKCGTGMGDAWNSTRCLHLGSLNPLLGVAFLVWRGCTCGRIIRTQLSSSLVGLRKDHSRASDFLKLNLCQSDPPPHWGWHLGFAPRVVVAVCSPWPSHTFRVSGGACVCVCVCLHSTLHTLQTTHYTQHNIRHSTLYTLTTHADHFLVTQRWWVQTTIE
jgi:hypothetical protein